MIPVLTPAESRALDEAAAEPVDVLIERAGGHVARHALDLLGGTYGRRVVVVAGSGNNGADGRAAAHRLTAAGVRVAVVPARDAPEVLPGSDLVIDAAVGTGFRDEYHAPDPNGAPVLAVDLPSGVDALTGVERGRANRAVRTVTFAGLKPGLLHGAGRALAGEVVVADIGLDASSAEQWVVERQDVSAWWPPRDPEGHKWRRAVLVVAGSPGMTGAAHLTCLAAQRAGAGMVRCATRADPRDVTPIEAVGEHLEGSHWADDLLLTSTRYGAVVVGPGLGRDDATTGEIRRLLAGLDQPVVVDADGLFALGDHRDGLELLASRSAPTVLTPHEGEFRRIFGEGFETDRVTAARRLAERAGCVVVLKGPATVVADPAGPVRWVTSGDERLSTGGTGDVLAGTVGAALAAGIPAAEAGAASAWVHGRAGLRCSAHGMVARDLALAVSEVLDDEVAAAS